jgi:serine/threonine protein kinase
VLGRGGMGDVLRAVRDDDQYRAEVAIKVMRADVRNARAEQRFRTERQILASLDHRNIARLLDGGTTATGLPYVVMELVNGEPIDRHCESRNLSARDIVQLFLQVCAAVSFAHQHLVVHRDLKPANIFVTADGSVKLLDFGIARLLEADETAEAKADATVTQLRAMTLEYASPEQLSGGAVTTVSDVYSLGVVLYRLLTGQSPYRATGGDAARVAEILGDTTPTRPSATRNRRGIDTDLDHILLMALRKEPAKRYGSVDQLAGDLRNYLQGHAVMARRGTLGYRSSKFIRRHRVPIAASVLIAMSLITGTAFAIREARIADVERETAQRHFDSVRGLANKLFDFHDEISKLPGATKAREHLMKTSLEYLDVLYEERSSERSLRMELAEGYLRMARLQGSPYENSTGDSKGALASFQRAATMAEALHAEDAQDDRVLMLLAKIYSHQTFLQIFSFDSEDYLDTAQRAVKYAQLMRAAENVDDARESAKVQGNAYFAQTMALNRAARLREALEAAKRMLRVVEAFATRYPDDIKGLEMLGAAYNNVGMLTDPSLPREQSEANAADLTRKSIAIKERLVALEPSNDSYQWDLADGRHNLANYYLFAGKPLEALALYDLATPVMAARAQDANNATAQLYALLNANNRAWAQFNLGQVDAADAALRRIISDFQSFNARNDNLDAKFGMATSLAFHGRLLASEPDTASKRQARALLQSGIETMQEIDRASTLTGVNRLVLDEALAALAELDKAAR